MLGLKNNKEPHKDSYMRVASGENMKISKIGLMGLLGAVVMLGGNSIKAQEITSDAVSVEAVSADAVIETYANIGQASYKDALGTAELLRAAVENLLNHPTDEMLLAAREAWRDARSPYEQSKLFVHSNPLITQWADRVSAWPVNVEYIDRISSTDVTGNNSGITAEHIVVLHHADGNLEHVASGYHVIEYLLWGPDESGIEEKDVDDGAGTRPATDYDLANCSNEDCALRGEYLYASVNLLIADLNEMVGHWSVTGEIRRTLLADPDLGIALMIKGMGSLSYGELAGARLLNAVQSHDPSSELDQFSNNSHVSYLLNARGMVSVYFGEYFSSDRELTTGASLADLLEQNDPDLDEEFRVALGFSLARMRLMIEYARDVEAFDLMIREGNKEGSSRIFAVIDALVDQVDILNRMSEALNVDSQEFFSSDILDAYVRQRS